jgi:hypothetical protein
LRGERGCRRTPIRWRRDENAVSPATANNPSRTASGHAPTKPNEIIVTIRDQWKCLRLEPSPRPGSNKGPYLPAEQERGLVVPVVAVVAGEGFEPS